MKRVGTTVIFGVLTVGFALAGIGAEPWMPRDASEVGTTLEGLAFDEFIEASYRLYALRYPEAVTSLGIADEYGVRNDALNVYTAEYIDETAAIERLTLDRLRSYDVEQLTTEQRTVYAVCLWYWEDLVDGQAFTDYEYPVQFLTVISWNGRTEATLIELHPFTTEDDVADYIERLSKLGAQFDQIIEQLDRRAELGLIAPRETLAWALPHIRGLMTAYTRSHPSYATLAEKAEAIEGLSDSDLADYLTETGLLINTVVKPAYRRLYNAVLRLMDDAPEALSFSQYDGGSEAYAYLLAHHTQTDLTAEEIHQLGVREVARVQAGVRAAADALDLDASLSLSELFAYAEAAAGTIPAASVVEEVEALIDRAEQIVVEATAFSRLPVADVVVSVAEQGGYYASPSLDGSRPGTYYVTAGSSVSRYDQVTVAFHEMIPGHHLQIALAQEIGLPLLCQDVIFTGFSEG